MNLYLIEDLETTYYDTCDSLVITAKTRLNAINLAHTKLAVINNVTHIGVSNSIKEEKIILSSFNAG